MANAVQNQQRKKPSILLAARAGAVSSFGIDCATAALTVAVVTIGKKQRRLRNAVNGRRQRNASCTAATCTEHMSMFAPCAISPIRAQSCSDLR